MVFDKHEMAINKYIVTNKTTSLDIFKAETALASITKISSCAVKAIYIDNTFKYLQIKFYTFQNREYNEVDYNSEVTKICGIIEQFDETLFCDSRYIYFNQSSLTSIDNAYAPFMYHLALSLHDNWEQIEVDDLYQMCRLCLCQLYNKGYCVHPGLIKKTFINHVLYTLRKDHRNSDIKLISIEKLLPTANNKSDLTIGDTIEDEVYNERRDKAEHDEIIESVFEIVNKVIIPEIGERRYKQLITAHRNKCANGSQRMLIIRIRKLLAKKGYDIEWFHKKLRGDL